MINVLITTEKSVVPSTATKPNTPVKPSPVRKVPLVTQVVSSHLNTRHEADDLPARPAAAMSEASERQSWSLRASQVRKDQARMQKYAPGGKACPTASNGFTEGMSWPTTLVTSLRASEMRELRSNARGKGGNTY